MADLKISQLTGATTPLAGTVRYTDTSGDGSSKSVFITFSGSRSAG